MKRQKKQTRGGGSTKDQEDIWKRKAGEGNARRATGITGIYD